MKRLLLFLMLLLVGAAPARGSIIEDRHLIYQPPAVGFREVQQYLTLPDNGGWLITGKDTDSWAVIAYIDARSQEQWRLRPGERTQDKILATVRLPEGGSVSLMTNDFLTSTGHTMYRHNLVYVSSGGELLRTEALEGPLHIVSPQLFAAKNGFLVFYTERIILHAENSFSVQTLEYRASDGSLRWKCTFDDIEVEIYAVFSEADGGLHCLAELESQATGQTHYVDLYLDAEGNLTSVVGGEE